MYNYLNKNALLVIITIQTSDYQSFNVEDTYFNLKNIAHPCGTICSQK